MWSALGRLSVNSQKMDSEEVGKIGRQKTKLSGLQDAVGESLDLPTPGRPCSPCLPEQQHPDS